MPKADLSFCWIKAPAGDKPGRRKFPHDKGCDLYFKSLRGKDVMKHVSIWVVVGLITGFGATAAAEDLRQGIHGMRWASPISAQNHLTQIRKSGQTAYYINSNTVYQVGSQPIPGVVYGFHKGRFFAAYIKLHTPDQFYNLQRHFKSRYGAPEMTADATIGQTVYRWKDDDVKIKLKMREPDDDMKLAIYYAPLATESNEAQTEQIPDDAFAPAKSTSGEAKPAAPLLE